MHASSEQLLTAEVTRVDQVAESLLSSLSGFRVEIGSMKVAFDGGRGEVRSIGTAPQR